MPRATEIKAMAGKKMDAYNLNPVGVIQAKPMIKMTNMPIMGLIHTPQWGSCFMGLLYIFFILLSCFVIVRGACCSPE